MSYAILNIVYGFPINNAHRTVIKQLTESELGALSEDEIDELENGRGRLAFFGFEGLYCAGGDDDIGYCGVELDRINEGENIKVAEITKLRPTSAQIKEANERYKKLRPELMAVADPPGIYFVWSSS